MKKTLILILFIFSIKGIAQQNKGVFSKDPVLNLENFQKRRLYFGFFLGLSSYDYKIDYKVPFQDIQIYKNIGFNAGPIVNLRLTNFLDLRFEPGFYYTKRDLLFPTTRTASDSLRNVIGINISLPLLLKFSALRSGNIRPYLIGGVSTNLNLASGEKSPDDNIQQEFRVKTWTSSYEMGFGVDIFFDYFIFSPSIRGNFGFSDELIPDNDPNSPWTGNISSLKSRAVFLNFSFH